ncbi:MAG: murein L,D-transpeptidase catalytic domain family protein [Chitinophagaceae bacterium]|nr:murein L,D-transpeptidase catalytic domain family protein [Chitinophagaceae bacterium]
MRNPLILLSLGILCASFTLVPATETNNNNNTVVAFPLIKENSSPYKTIELDQYGLSEEAFNYAWQGYQKLIEENKISSCDYLTICDFSQSSKQKRLYIIDVTNNKLLIHTHVAHGKNSGAEYATKFSNTPESLQSSLGFYITSNTYIGKHGLSLRLNGVDPGYNDKALERTIVIHGAAYVDAARVKAGMYMGRSWGCPAVPQKESANIITTIKNGTCLFIYYPSRNYLQNSKILND